MNRATRSTQAPALLVAISTIAAVTAGAAIAGTLSVTWYTIDGGGNTSGAGGLVVRGTIGQPEASTVAAGSLTLTGGFWSVPTSAAPSDPADLDGNGTVNGADLGLLLGNWAGAGAGDLNNDGIVDGADLGLLLGEWD